MKRYLTTLSAAQVQDWKLGQLATIHRAYHKKVMGESYAFDLTLWVYREVREWQRAYDDGLLRRGHEGHA